MAAKISNQPLKGTRDWEPAEFAIRHHIFETWRKVNLQFSYAEYLTPLLESADIYRAKSGEDIGGKELMIMRDQKGRELALRPEMTPSVTRMVSRLYRQAAKPMRLFSIANFWRNERPQRGRNREFWQLNTDIFGTKSINADLEILQVALQIMRAFKPPKNAFTLYLNHRVLIDAVLTTGAGVPHTAWTPVVRLLDKFDKLPLPTFEKALNEQGLNTDTIGQLIHFMEAKTADDLLSFFPELEINEGFQQVTHLLSKLQQLGYGDVVVFDPSVIRGFDYYDGMVFEVFDNHPQNNRSLFGGGRYNGLANIFGNEDIPAVGFAPGDEATRLFIESWGLVPSAIQTTEAIYLPLLTDAVFDEVSQLASQLRQADVQIEQGLEPQTMKTALNYANKRGFSQVILLGVDEVVAGSVSLKDMHNNTQISLTVEALITQLRTG